MQSSRFSNSEKFVQSFLDTIMPGVIPIAEFVDWKQIDKKAEIYKRALEFFENIEMGALTDALLADDEPYTLVKCAFELLAHTSQEFVTQEYDININEIAKRIANGDEESASLVSLMLENAGLGKLLDEESIASLFTGVQIGLETHRRKNVGGTLFKKLVAENLYEIKSNLEHNFPGLRISEEVNIQGDRTNEKRVDFALSYRGKLVAAIEVNFYTTTGSKPTEIKRSYGQLLEWLNRKAIRLIWITDGKGYRSMKKSLADAFGILPDIYNARMVNDYLETDLSEILYEIDK